MYVFFLLMLVSVVGCRTAPPTAIEQRAEQVQQFNIAITFKGMEGLKRVPYKYPALRLEMVRELSREPLTVLFRLPCTAQELDGHLFKLGQDADVILAEHYE